jgi:NitT/TauT family transport system substrate-binding protein
MNATMCIRMKRMRACAVAAAALSLLVAGCGSSAQPSGPNGSASVKVVVSVASIAYAPLYIAEKQGYFKDQKITVSITTVSGGGATVPALQSGSAQFGFSSVFHQLDAVEQGQKIVSIAGINTGEGLDVVVSKKKAAQLGLTANSTLAEKGAALRQLKVGVVSTSGEPFYVLADLAKAGGVKSQDLHLQAVAGSAGITAMKTGQIDAMTIGLPVTTQAIAQAGAQMLVSCPAGDLPDLKDAPTETILASASYISSHADVTSRFVRAIGQAEAYLKANSDQAAETVRNGYFPTVDKSVFDTAWAEIAMVTPATPALTAAQLQNTIDFVTNATGKKVKATGADLLGTVK